MPKWIVAGAILALALVACGDEGPQSLEVSEALVSVEELCVEFCGEGNPGCLQECVDICYQRLWQANIEDCAEVPPFTQ